MTKYREILRLSSLKLSQQSIADSCRVSKKTVNSVLKKAREKIFLGHLIRTRPMKSLPGFCFRKKASIPKHQQKECLIMLTFARNSYEMA